MKMEDIFKLCEAKSIRIFREQDELVVQAPRGAMNTELATLLRENKQNLLESLLLVDVAADTTDTGFNFKITPDMLTLVDLSQQEIDGIVDTVKGGAGNIKDIYPLAPLQEGILFHHLMQTQGDVYLLPNVIAFKAETQLQSFLAAMQKVINRHDVLRTGIVWQGLEEPVQVVCRQTQLPVETLHFDESEGDVQAQLEAYIDPGHFRFDVSHAPLLRSFITRDAAKDRWLLAILIHHMAADHTTLELMISETIAIQMGLEAELPNPVPFRNFVAQARLGVSKAEHDAFFTEMLGDISEPTMPFDVQDVQGDASEIEESHLQLDSTLAQAIRQESKRAGVSAASLFHLAWGMVLARVTGRADIVFGTVLFGRMQGGAQADRGMGLFINTLPLRVTIGETSVVQSLKQTHLLLVKLLKHEHASLAQAQRASAVSNSAPLFTAFLNYRYSAMPQGQDAQHLSDVLGFEPLSGHERTNYPLSLAIDDQGEGFVLTIQARKPISANRITGYLHRALVGLIEQIQTAPERDIASIDVLPAEEKELLTRTWNNTDLAYPHDNFIYDVFEMQAMAHPSVTALIYEDQKINYGELNARANRLAHHLRDKGVVPDSRVAICLERGIDLITALLAVHKAGGAYVPLDPAYPADRLAHMLSDSEPVVCLVHAATKELMLGMGGENLVDLDGDRGLLHQQPAHKLTRFAHASTNDLAYVIYTSGSTGKPKGVMVTHRNLMNFMVTMEQKPGLSSSDVLLNVTSLSFDIAALEIFLPLLCGARIILTSRITANDPHYLSRLIDQHHVTVMQATPSTWRMLVEHGWPTSARNLKIMVGGEALPVDLARDLFNHVPAIWNLYGPTETTIWSTLHCIKSMDEGITIGNPIANTRLYILDEKCRPVPQGASGELFIGGDGVTRGYLNRPELTAERFLRDPFARDANARMYRTGDLCRFRADGKVEYLGRNDFQVKIRGFRIELGEIETKLNALSSVREAVVIARDDRNGEKQLVAFAVMRDDHALDVAAMRAALANDLPQFMLPNIFVQLASMPLTPNGKLDRKALLESKDNIEKSSAASAQTGRAPETDAEIKLHEQWLYLLKIEHRNAISVDEDFFDLGGTSLSIIRMVSFISREFGADVSVTDLFNHRTIQDLARFLETQTKTRKQLPIVSFGLAENPKIFCVPGVNGHALSFKDLANTLPDYNLQCFEPIDVRGQQLVPFATIDELCEAYLHALKEVQPAGHYRLIGHSHGGLIALKLASLLKAEGHIVESVGLIDTVADVSEKILANVRAHRNAQALDADYMNFIFSNFENYLQCDLQVDLPRLNAMTDEQRVAHVAQNLADQNIIHSADVEFVRDYLISRKQHDNTVTDYFIEKIFPAFDGNICLFKASEGSNDFNEVADDYGWNKFLSGNFQIVSVDGNHESLVIAPQVNSLGTALRQFIESV